MHHRHELLSVFREIWKYMATLPDDQIAVLVDTALRMEQRTAPRRADDDLLRRDGLDDDGLRRANRRTLEVRSDYGSSFGITKQCYGG
jgi:hypothetical protein